jgi:DNA-binding beta-propeller fold protein YncE
LDFDGNIVDVFDTPGLFGGPKKIVISSDEKFIYVSDYNNVSKRSKFLKIDWQGNIVQRFEDQ